MIDLTSLYGGGVCVCAQSYLTLCGPMDCSLSGSSVYGIFQARILEWVIIFFSIQEILMVFKSLFAENTVLVYVVCHWPSINTNANGGKIFKDKGLISNSIGNPLQCSCLENPRDGGAWWAAVYGVAQSRTRLTRLSSSSSNSKTAKKSRWGFHKCMQTSIQYNNYYCKSLGTRGHTGHLEILYIDEK